MENPGAPELGRANFLPTTPRPRHPDRPTSEVLAFVMSVDLTQPLIYMSNVYTSR